jgi:hypothetical protein
MAPRWSTQYRRGQNPARAEGSSCIREKWQVQLALVTAGTTVLDPMPMEDR